MTKFNLDHALVGLAVATVGGGALALTAHSAPVPTDPQHQFTRADYAAFTRNFETDGANCAVGFQERSLCFETSHLENRIVEGQPFPENMYPLALEWRANLALTRKDQSLKTVRIGQTLALMERDTRMVVDTMHLGETDYAGATTRQAS
ncbi:hypothetical protein [Henriciella aquimarina]|uniref:hypothetical protein n=1 Tax=Henriciella aquimarina TaxID=545261 RepID=UPI000A0373B8|nr:hypothetical protein [Henriciella aquimarina]